MDTPILVLDTASPTVSVAIGRGGEVLSERVLELRRSSERLLRTVEEALEEAGCRLDDLGGVVALQGPGSFTGLRIGLATVLGFHQALGLPATACPTLPVLAMAVAPAAEDAVPVIAAVDAMRGDWYVRTFLRSGGGRPVPEGPARLEAGKDLATLAPSIVIGFGIGRLRDELPEVPQGLELVEPPPLAPVALRVFEAEATDWDPARLTRPIYFREPAVTLPKSAVGTRR